MRHCNWLRAMRLTSRGCAGSLALLGLLPPGVLGLAAGGVRLLTLGLLLPFFLEGDVAVRAASFHCQVTPANPSARDERRFASQRGVGRPSLGPLHRPLKRPTGPRRIGSPCRKRRRSSARSGRGVAPSRLLPQALQADRLQVARHARLQTAAAAPARRAAPAAGVQRRRALERRPAGEQLVEDRAEGVDVGRRADRRRLPLGLLGGHVARRAERRRRLRSAACRSERLARPKSVILGVAAAPRDGMARSTSELLSCRSCSAPIRLVCAAGCWPA